ncbi:MAG TPA: aldehyde ferredoxin oxidoreductase family protein [Smithella sp.]|nr:aldehyde ferredoxin oxidoreductase family protein [Smithella sp.]HNY49837.1 aldehyde ferredoxin oxidoreductase family protein [Smithella sp.]HOG91093.1 aldehyde ferredoxin oxidoreductase family protein [Smithella sp.]HOU51288.1 aldehyde ferredoxin oxidoreductase family protein [Smithella sp.]HQG65489.1 aldehyde ferredoxin oxidoreductase family protein [Smithella sp.]
MSESNEKETTNVKDKNIPEIVGTSNKVLEVDLNTKTYTVYQVKDDERKMYLGGKGLGLKLIYDRMPAGVDPLGKDNILAFMPGVLMGTGAPCSGRFSGITKSPLTGIMDHASCGGPFGMSLKTAGWDGILVKGKSDVPVYLVVTSSGVEFKDASHLWGKDAFETQDMLGKNKNAGAVAIGQAGENKVLFANIVSGKRFLGRGGMGAVMGAKNLKAIYAIGGAYKIVAKDREKFDKVKKLATKRINANAVTSNALRRFGTNNLVNYTNLAGIMPVRNFTSGSSDNAYKLTGEYFSENFNTKHHTCKPCTILCGKSGKFNGKDLSVPEYETVGLMGSNLEIFDPVKVAEWNDLCGRFGMDTISMGGTLSWVMEAGEKGLVKTDLKFGSPEGVAQAIEDTAFCRGFGAEMARGSRALSKKYGGEDFAINVKGMELAAYDPRGSYGMGLNYAVANRGACHLSSTVMAQENFVHVLDPYSTIGKHVWVKFFEDFYCAMNSLHTCTFTSFAYILENPLTKYNGLFYLKMVMGYLYPLATKIADISIYHKFWSTITGLKMSRSEFLKAGERIHILERYMNTREGITVKDDTLPGRLLKEGRTNDPKGRVVPLEEMRKKYYRIRSYDENGKPTANIMKKLSIDAR